MAKLSVEDEVLANLRNTPLGPMGGGDKGGNGAGGPGTVGDLDLPLDFLRRVADRTIQAWFRERARVVVGDGNLEHQPPAVPPDPAEVPAWIQVTPGQPGPTEPLLEYRPSDRSFRAPLTLPMHTSGLAVRPENLPSRPSWIRIQLTSAGYYAGPGDGGSLDIARQLVESGDSLEVVASVEDKHLRGVVANASRWKPGPGVRLVLIPEPFTISQWARDNAVVVHDQGHPGRALLTPRWAGRGEEGGIYIPGESLAMEGLTRAGWHIRQSDLLFEGGNVLVVDDGSKRVLLLGEAEVHRNVGLMRDQAILRFRERFLVDDVLILPAASFHIDLEVAVLPGQGGPVVFVPDTLAAVRTVCRLAARALHQSGRAEAEALERCEDPNATLSSLLSSILPALEGQSSGSGRYPYELARLFRASNVDSGVGNFHRVWFALDYLMAECGIGIFDDGPHAAYLRSIRRQERDRASIGRQLRQRGWKVVKVPAISSESCSLNAVNGVWAGDHFLMSAYGGFFEALDAAAEQAFQSEGFRVQRVSTGETQRRSGGLHCAVSVG